MGAQVLETLSRDRDEYIAYYQRLKAEADKESQLLYAHSEGLKEGLKEGIKEGKKEGLEEGKKEGAREKEIQIAKNLFLIGLALEQIEDATGLSTEELQNICKQ